MSFNKPITEVHDQYYDRQWDARFNVQTDGSLSDLVDAIKREWESGKFQYILIGGTEVGTRPYQNDYQVRHVHVAAIFNNRVSKRSILTNWNIKQGNGYYLVPRNRDLPYSGWRSHHIKEFSKTDKTKPIIFEMGTLPEDIKKKRVEASEEEKKRKIDEVLIDMRGLIEEGKEDEAFKKYPRNYLTYGEKIKAMVTQKKDFFKTNGDPHIWLHGYPGTGKTAVLALVYPNYYKKNLHNKFFDLYDPKVHSHIMLEDVDYECMERLGVNFFKTICDEAGFPVDQKYKTPQLTRTTCLVTSNFSIEALLKPDEPGFDANCAALLRRFWHIDINSVLRYLGLKLLPKSQRNELKADGNTDVRKLFISWDYLTGTPTCTPLKSSEDYQKLIKDAFYK